MRKKTNTRAPMIPADTFVKAWMKADTVNDVAEALDREVGTIHNRAQSLRKAGVRLPKLKRVSHSRLDVDALNALIKD
jgi:hypothetical protein